LPLVLPVPAVGIGASLPVFIGAALGLCAHALVPAVQSALGVAAGVLGVQPVVTRHSRLSLFTAAMPAPDRSILALLCIASLPAWLLVTGRPQMHLRADGAAIR
jgi:hypothetical protein